ncbi:hypothetical protein HBA55_05950 [Pseudomaricurvus alkylphenolicus]|uniref:citrate/2-methylcitrate synthase n=1 Tax=Pseudomaricurvus alkylphenolicus TaxID=1306991 RepID=UPI00141F8C58|nr:citrate/2-methylcitrate synthase [Pseudomaricurvus alkylphenolicus]NIB39118.1 hypothetical protein [Pseudomaricurvus alkylphenolicus]
MNHAEWDDYHGVIRSRKGGWLIGRGVNSHGLDLMNEVVGHCSYMQVVMLNATGRLPSPQLGQWMDAIHICLSWPDPRIWCNRIGALAGAARTSPVAATCAGVMAADSRSYGIRPLQEGVEFIQRAFAEIDTRGIDVTEFVEQEVRKHGGKPYLMGYARPIAKGDERIGAMQRVAHQLGFEDGPHLRLAYAIESCLSNRFDETMNINGYMSGFLSDQGYSPEEVHRIFSALVFSGVTACYVDTVDRPEGAFAPLKVEDIEYSGADSRALPPRE